MLQVSCSGTPYEIGQQHGSTAAKQVKGSLAFYKGFFEKQTRKSWTEVQSIAETFLPYLESSWPEYVEEMRGLAEGAGVEFVSVLALNVRTEIGFGLIGDGCTAFSWKSGRASFLAQNWDWNQEQKQNIIVARIQQPGKPKIAMMTEAGIIGKIGLNDAGVGVTLNAIKAKGADVNKLPVHLALRTVLNSQSQSEARQILLDTGVSAAGHITIADGESGGVGLECSAVDIVELEMKAGICTHTNHMVQPHLVKDLFLLEDSPARLARVQQLLSEAHQTPTMDQLRTILKDEQNSPVAICRSQSDVGTIETLFSIVMNLEQRHAKVKMGKPTENGEELDLIP